MRSSSVTRSDFVLHVRDRQLGGEVGSVGQVSKTIGLAGRLRRVSERRYDAEWGRGRDKLEQAGPNAVEKYESYRRNTT